MCKSQIFPELTTRPPIGASTLVPSWAINAYEAPQAQPLPTREEPPVVMGGQGRTGEELTASAFVASWAICAAFAVGVVTLAVAVVWVLAMVVGGA